MEAEVRGPSPRVARLAADVCEPSAENPVERITRNSTSRRRSSGGAIVHTTSLSQFLDQTVELEISEAFGLACDPLGDTENPMLSTDRFNDALRFLGVCLKPSALQGVIQRADPTGTGFASRTVFLETVMPMLSTWQTTNDMRRASMIEAFRAVDVDNNGYVHLDDFRKGAAYVESFPSDREALFMAVRDLARDGRLYYSEFIDKYAPAKVKDKASVVSSKAPAVADAVAPVAEHGLPEVPGDAHEASSKDVLPVASDAQEPSPDKLPVASGDALEASSGPGEAVAGTTPGEAAAALAEAADSLELPAEEAAASAEALAEGLESSTRAAEPEAAEPGAAELAEAA